MSVKGFIICVCLGLCISCAPRDDENEAVPGYVLSEEVFLNMLTDCYLGEGAAGINVKNATGSRFDSAYLFNPFKDRGISRQQFDTTIEWYSRHPKKLKDIYSKLLENLSRILAVGNLGGGPTPPQRDRYEGQDARFYFNQSKVDSIEAASATAGYSRKQPYLIH